MVFFKIVVLSFLAFYNFSYSSAYNVRGYVKNEHTKKPIKDVNVVLKELNQGTTTDENGYFDFQLDIPSNEIYIEFSHISFATIRWRGPPSEIINLEMKETFLKLSEVVITGTKTEFKSSDVPVFTEIINSSDIQASNAFTVGELIEDRAGVCKMYNFDGSFDYNLLGLDSKYILVLKDGQPITGKFADKIDLDQIVLANVEKIEILKGPGSALYGTEAMGGVINIISKRSTANYSGEIKFKNENFDGISSKFLENPSAQNLSYNISIPIESFRLDLSSTYQLLGKGENFTITGKDEASKINLDFGLSWHSPNKKHLIKTGYNYFSRFDTTNTYTITDLLVKSSSTKILRKEIIAGHDFRIKKNILLTQRLNINNYDRTYEQTGIDDSFRRYANSNEKLSDYEMKIDVNFEKMSTVGGFEISDPSFKNDRAQGKTYSRKTRSVFVQNDYKFSEKSKIIAGLRYDQYGRNQVYSPRLAYLFQISEEMKFRISTGTGFRIPSFLELYIDFYNVDNGYVVKGNKFLKPEKSAGSTINLEYISEKLRLNALAYQNRFKDKIISTYKDTTSTIVFFEYENLARSEFRGIELFLDYLINSMMSFKCNVNIRKAVDGQDMPIENIIPYSAGTRLAYDMPSLSLKLYFQSTFNFLSNSIDSFSIHNLKIRKRIYKNMYVAGGVENMGNITNDRLGPFIGRSVFLELVKKIG